MSEPTNDKLRELLENPENLALIARLVGSMSGGGLGSLLSGGGGGKRTTDTLSSEEAVHLTDSTDAENIEAEQTQPASTLPPPEKLPAFGRDLSTDKRIALLNALRPYINDSKKERVDGLVRALRVAGLLNQYKGTLL